MALNRACVASVLMAWLALADSAHAGPVELFAQVVFDPNDSQVMAVRYLHGGEGLFYSRDGGKSWQMQCGAGIEPSLIHLAPFAIAGDGRSLIAGELGRQSGNNVKTLFEDDGHSCAWTQLPEFDQRTVTNLTPHPTDPDVIFASISDQRQPNGILRRDAKGAWSDLGARSEPYITRLLVAKTDTGLRLYETAYFVPDDALEADGGALPWTNWLRISDDEGKTWQEKHFGSSEQPFELLDVDPSNPDRIVALIRREGADDTLFVSNDQGTSFAEYMSLTDFGGLAFSPDGQAWIGDAGNPMRSTAQKGLSFATSLGESAVRIAEFPVACVGYQATAKQLYACRLAPGADAFGSVDMADGAFKALLSFGKIEDFVKCAGVDSAASCKRQLCGAYCGLGHFAKAPICSTYSEPTCGPCAADPNSAACTTPEQPGGKDAGTSKDAGSVDKQSKSQGCGCRTLAERTDNGGSNAMFVLLGIAFALRARRRSKPRMTASTPQSHRIDDVAG